MKIKKVLTANLKPGMVAAEAAYTYTNHLVIQSNTVLTEEIIEKLKYYAVKAVKVYEQEEIPIKKPTPTPIHAPATDTGASTYFDRVQNTQEFCQFETEFSTCIDSFKNSLNDIVTKSSDGLVDNMLNDVKSLLRKSRNPLHLLDMMQCMRGYDDLTYAHSMNVALICNVIGTWLHMNDNDLNVLTICGMLHDIGKLRIPAEIITKPGKLTDEEFNIVRNHPRYGYEILKDKALDKRVCLAALQHHERYNGSGYPYQLPGAKIEYFSSIVAVADVYDAMTSNRCYRKGICPFPVIELMEREKEYYEPSVLLLFIERTIEAYINTEVLLSNNEKGRVILLNKSFISRPVVISETGQTYDLSKNSNLQIEALI